MNLCECGCGKVVYNRFVSGHNLGSMQNSINWKGGNTTSNGYQLTYDPTHKRAMKNKYVKTHIAIGEKVLGKPLPKDAVIHHVDEDPSNNKKNNLVICENNKYHLLLHNRKKAYEACGHADWMKCWICKRYDSIDNLYVWPNKHVAAHRKCNYEYKRKRKQLKEV